MQNVRGSGGWFLLASVDGFSFTLGVGLGLSVLAGLGLCRVAAFGLGGLRELAILFITVSHCAFLCFVSLQTRKETKQRNALQPSAS
jgi:hypothetical protein